ncbi:MAG: hypothetical protein PVG83_05120 [Acidimicrobiia bacterium]|jgi:hypothetical protein
MKLSRILASVIALALAAYSITTVTSWYSDSETMTIGISAASDFGDHDGKVWVCKLVGSEPDVRVAPGKNPIHVSISSVTAEEGFSDAHSSYVVDSEHVKCEVPDDGDHRAVGPVTPITSPGGVTMTTPAATTTTIAEGTVTTAADTTTTTTPQQTTTSVDDTGSSTTTTPSTTSTTPPVTSTPGG